MFLIDFPRINNQYIRMKTKLRVVNGLLILALIGCSSVPTPQNFQTRIYQGNYDDVWLATLKALSDYPLKTSNKDTGKIQTEIINGPYNELLMTHIDAIELPERFRYFLDLSMAKLNESEKEPLVRIRAKKNLDKFQDFYTGYLPFPSDGIEEKIILYRISHILEMEKAMVAPPTNSGKQ